MRNSNELYESIGAKKIYISSIYDENNQYIDVIDQEVFLVHCVEDYSPTNEVEQATLKDGLRVVRNVITGYVDGGSFTIKSLSPELRAMMCGERLKKGSLITGKAVSATIPVGGELAINLEAGQAIVSVLNVVGENGDLYRQVNTLAPEPGEFVVDGVNSELIFNVADEGKKIAISRIYKDNTKGASYEIYAHDDLMKRIGFRLVVEDLYSGEIETFENVMFSVSKTASVADFRTYNLTFTAAACPKTGRVRGEDFQNFKW